MINPNLPQGTWVKFTSDARLRKVTAEGRREQSGMNEGVLIGEKLRAVVVQKMGEDAYTVLIPEGNYFGWCYNFEMYVEDALQPPAKLDLIPQNKR